MTKVINVPDEAEPLPKGYGFSLLEPEPDLGPDASVFDSSPISRMERLKSYDAELVGMTTKPRDPADATLIQNFIARHGLRLVGFFPKVLPGGFLCNGVAGGPAALWMRELRWSEGLLVRPIHRSQNGIIKFLPGEVSTKAGKRWMEPSEQAELRRYKTGFSKPADSSGGLMHTTGGEASRSGVYRAQDAAISMAGVFEEGLSIQSSGMSLAEIKHSRLRWDPANKVYRQAIPKSQKLPTEGKLPDRHCQNPECLKEIDEDSHHNVQYCNAKCTARAKELRRRHEKREAKRSLVYRNESVVAADLLNNIKHLDGEIVSPHISIGRFSEDCPVSKAA